MIHLLNKQQRKKLIVGLTVFIVLTALYLCVATATLLKDRVSAYGEWDGNFTMTPESAAQIQELAQDATHVSIGTYVEGLSDLSLKDSSFRITMLVWFRWQGNAENEQLNMAENFRVYNGAVNSLDVVKDTTTADGLRYQLVRCDVTISRQFWTVRFPLDSHKIIFYIESEYPADTVVFTNDSEESGINNSLHVLGYKLTDFDTAVTAITYGSAHGDPELENGETASELAVGLEINRDGVGLYFKCFMSLFGSSLWGLAILWMAANEKIDDPFAMVASLLLGPIANIMVGADLLPDALQMGLLEYVNIFGFITIMACVAAVLIINDIRGKEGDAEFARYYGHKLLHAITIITLAGNIILPLAAYKL